MHTHIHIPVYYITYQHAIQCSIPSYTKAGLTDTLNSDEFSWFSGVQGCGVLGCGV